MSKGKRYAVTYSMWVYARDDDHARSKAKMIQDRENEKYPQQDCKIEEIKSVPFASLDVKPIQKEPCEHEWKEPFASGYKQCKKCKMVK